MLLIWAHGKQRQRQREVEKERQRGKQAGVEADILILFEDGRFEDS